MRRAVLGVFAACSAALAALASPTEPGRPQPVELMRWKDAVGIVAASGPDLVVYTATSIAIVPKMGGPMITLAAFGDGPARAMYDLVADDARVYWITPKSDAIWSVDRRGGGSPRRLVLAHNRVLSALAQDAGTLVYQEQTSRDSVAIVAVDGNGLHRRVLVAGLSTPTRHVVVHGEVFYGAQSKVWSVALVGGAPRTVASETTKIIVKLRDPVERDRVIGTREELAPITALTVDDTHIYFAGPGGARRVARAGGAWTEFPPGIPQPHVQNSTAFFTRDGVRLLRIPKTGGTQETLAVAPGPIGTLAIDGKALFFNVGGALMRLDLD